MALLRAPQEHRGQPAPLSCDTSAVPCGPSARPSRARARRMHGRPHAARGTGWLVVAEDGSGGAEKSSSQVGTASPRPLRCSLRGGGELATCVRRESSKRSAAEVEHVCITGRLSIQEALPAAWRSAVALHKPKPPKHNGRRTARL